MPNTTDDFRKQAARMVTQRLESLQRAGVTHLPKAGRSGSKTVPETAHKNPQDSSHLPNVEGERIESSILPLPHTDSNSSSSPAPKMTAPTMERSLFDTPTAERPLMSPEQRAAALEIIQREVAACTRCPALVANRTQTVFGVGNNSPRICFFGEAPGADEDRLGEPFVGRGGQLLNKMIAACGLKREEVYILNVLKCRPPDNRNPLPDEVSNCRGYFERQIEILRPEMICCLGAVASKALLNTERAIGKLRGSFHDYQGIAVVCTYHPAYLLRNPAAKVDAWEDLKMMMRKLGVEL
jgi:uracil-DNA glycosylase